jgi:Zn-dependent M28 family amino/carboxypeptidase
MKQFLLSLFITLGNFVFGQNTNDSLSIEQLKSFLYTLADDSMKGRASGSLEEQKAYSYISSTFRQQTGKKLKPQAFSFTKDSVRYNCKNAYYFINNHAEKTILLSAHYDHIGFGGPLSKSFTSSEIHNGADDNASGVALLLSISKELIQQVNPKVNYLIVFYSGHELGLYGSKAFYDWGKNIKKFKQLSMVLNLDMVGRMDPSNRKLKCMRSSDLDSLLHSLPMDQFKFKLNITEEEKLSLLDTKHFFEAGIPCINFTTGMHNDYHKSSDDAKYVNYEALNDIRTFVLYLAEMHH